jgi:hypothetical protein
MKLLNLFWYFAPNFFNVYEEERKSCGNLTSGTSVHLYE